MQDFRSGDLTIHCTEGEDLQFVWTGRSTDRTPGETLAPFFKEALTSAEAKARPIVMRFETLDYLNSSTMSAIIGLVQDARARRVRLVLAYKKSLRWQRLSFEPLQVLAGADQMLELRSS
jgi:hypothetical protein